MIYCDREVNVAMFVKPMSCSARYYFVENFNKGGWFAPFIANAFLCDRGVSGAYVLSDTSTINSLCILF